MRYASVCDGIGAAHAAFSPLGWTCAWRSEIDAFPKAVVAHRWPSIGPDLGDMTKITDEEIAAHGPIDILVGGTPCQSFSVAGLRKGMADDRGNLALVFLELARRSRAEWLVWENVPGVLSSNGGRDFGAFLGGLVELGYGFAYRVLDAQYFGLAQRRKRVFVVARLGDWRASAAVLLERACLRGDLAPSREAGEDAALAAPLGAKDGGGRRNDLDNETYVRVMPCLRTNHYNNSDPAMEAQMLVAQTLKSYSGRNQVEANYVPVAFPIQDATNIEKAQGGVGVGDSGDPAYTLQAEAQGGVAVTPFDTMQVTSAANYSQPKPGDPCHPLAVGAHAPAVAFTSKDHGQDVGNNVSPTLRAMQGEHANAGGQVAVTYVPDTADPICANEQRTFDNAGNNAGRPHNLVAASTVRRLTPSECEALQGFERNYTLVPYRGKPAADGPRYKALGNSWAVPVVAWIGRRVEALADGPRGG